MSQQEVDERNLCQLFLDVMKEVGDQQAKGEQPFSSGFHIFTVIDLLAEGREKEVVEKLWRKKICKTKAEAQELVDYLKNHEVYAAMISERQRRRSLDCWYHHQWED